MTGFWRELERARKERIRQDNARAREEKAKRKLARMDDEIYQMKLMSKAKGAMPSGSRIRKVEGSGSPIGSENSRSVRKRLVRSRVEHPGGIHNTENTLPVGSKGQKKQHGAMGKFT
tara:strand:- start:41 stop:391 length:351 start_codon:yes stop_codon:yes gene_type:complete